MNASRPEITSSATRKAGVRGFRNTITPGLGRSVRRSYFVLHGIRYTIILLCFMCKDCHWAVLTSLEKRSRSNFEQAPHPQCSEFHHFVKHPNNDCTCVQSSPLEIGPYKPHRCWANILFDCKEHQTIEIQNTTLKCILFTGWTVWQPRERQNAIYMQNELKSWNMFIHEQQTIQ